MKELVEEPSDQALRFIAHLKANRGQISFPGKRGVNEVDTSAVNYFIPLGVTFYHLGVIGTNLKLLTKGEITKRQIHELAPSISLTDLQVVFNILTTEAQKMHYLQRRRELEMQVEYIGDELDLLGFYLDTGFNIGDMESTGKTALNLSLKSKDLDPYIVGLSSGKLLPKPELKMTAWWKDILNLIDARKTERWLEFSYILLNIHIDYQRDLEKKYKTLVNRILKKKTKDNHNWITYRTASRQRQFSIVTYPYENKYIDERNNTFSEIAGQEFEANPDLKGVVIIGVNLDKGYYPYSALAGELSVALFDNLFSSMSAI